MSLNQTAVATRLVSIPRRTLSALGILSVLCLSLFVSSAWGQEEEFVTGGEPTIDDSRCETPDVLLLLDRSGSMLDDMKWEQATTAVSEVFAPYFDVLRFGLLPFPTEGSCGVIETPLAIPIGEAEGADLDAIYQSVLPVDIALTPLADTISAGKRALDAVREPNRRGFIIMLTDGIETCAPVEVENTAPVDAARLAADAGYTVYVVGFGSRVRRNVLNEMALVGGSERSRLVSDQASLETTLAEIVDSATTEICDLLDNDCDGRIDEGVDCAPPCYPEIEECPCTNSLECNSGERCEAGQCAPIPCELACDQGYICRNEECVSIRDRAPAGGETAGSQAGSSPQFAGQSATPPNQPPPSSSKPGGASAGVEGTSGASMAGPSDGGCQVIAHSSHLSLTLLGLIGLLGVISATRSRTAQRTSRSA